MMWERWPGCNSIKDERKGKRHGKPVLMILEVVPLFLSWSDNLSLQYERAILFSI